MGIPVTGRTAPHDSGTRAATATSRRPTRRSPSSNPWFLQAPPGHGMCTRPRSSSSPCWRDRSHSSSPILGSARLDPRNRPAHAACKRGAGGERDRSHGDQPAGGGPPKPAQRTARRPRSRASCSLFAWECPPPCPSAFRHCSAASSGTPARRGVRHRPDRPAAHGAGVGAVLAALLVSTSVAVARSDLR